jgi:flagellar basal-body rod protein FlgF
MPAQAAPQVADKAAGRKWNMVRGIYTAASGMMTIQELTATTASNLANADTAGFKADMLLFTSAPAIHTWRVGSSAGGSARDAGGAGILPANKDGGLEAHPTKPFYLGLTNCGVADTEIWRDFSQGQLVPTGQPLDVAIVGDGFFRVAQDGEELYSRDGQFRVGPDGYLMDNLGRRVQGLGGDINTSGSNDVYINASGEVYAGAELLDRLNLAFFSDPQQQLSKLGDNAWRASGAPDGVGVTDVRGGYIERSNVDVFRCISELIMQLRHFEAAQRVVTTEDATLELAANQLGKLPG